MSRLVGARVSVSRRSTGDPSRPDSSALNQMKRTWFNGSGSGTILEIAEQMRKTKVKTDPSRSSAHCGHEHIREPRTFLLVDGENVDATLGGGLLGRRPAPEERPRWDRVRDYAQAIWEQPARGLFFLNATSQVPLELRPGADHARFSAGAPERAVGGQGGRCRDPANARGAGRARRGRRAAGQP